MSTENNYRNTENDFSKKENVHRMALTELSPSRITPYISWKNYKLTFQIEINNDNMRETTPERMSSN